MNDEAILREAEAALREALSVEPSPLLLRQVRASADRARTGWPMPWPIAAAAGLVLASAVALALLRPSRAGGLEPAVAPASVSTPAAATAEAPVPIVPLPIVPPKPAISPLPRPLRASLPSSPEIIVPRGQAEAIARFVELTSSGVIVPPRGLVDPLDPSESLAEPAFVRIEPLTIAPIEAPSSSPVRSPLGRGDF